ncbi:MAG: hypothetical protein LBF17_06675 [Mediterranea sp.]|jgi:hypothetical protein|nr:hypothetical protein [Mediterranea sp.]
MINRVFVCRLSSKDKQIKYSLYVSAYVLIQAPPIHLASAGLWSLLAVRKRIFRRPAGFAFPLRVLSLSAGLFSIARMSIYLFIDMNRSLHSYEETSSSP